METKIQKHTVGHLTVYLESEVDEHGKLWDTKVTINDTLLCWISGAEVDEFINDFIVLVQNYRI